MSNESDFTELLPAIEAITDEEIYVSKSIPVDVYVQEGLNLQHTAEKDQAELTAVGLDQEIITGLEKKANALQWIESLWTHKRLGEAELREQWNIKAPEAYELRNDILHDCDYAADEDEDLLNRVEHIREGTSNADLMQDLSDLIVLCNDPDMQQLLEKINFDTTKIELVAMHPVMQKPTLMN